MNATAAAFIKAHEGCRLTAYLDSVGVPTIGWGATGPDIHMGLVWTQQMADDRLALDIAKFEAGVRAKLTRPLSEQQEAALISFAFNLGLTAFAGSQLLRLVNAGDWFGAAHEIPKWDHAGKVELRGLLIRRFEEGALFMRGCP